jgi:hypothetical protein
VFHMLNKGLNAPVGRSHISKSLEKLSWTTSINQTLRIAANDFLEHLKETAHMSMSAVTATRRLRHDLHTFRIRQCRPLGRYGPLVNVRCKVGRLDGLYSRQITVQVHEPL